MKLVIDASVAVKWFIDEPRHRLARDVLVQGFELAAPDLILVEVANALRNKVRNGLANKADMVTVLERLPAMFEHLAETRGTLADAFEMACQINHPVADCVYLACARVSGAALLTDDETLYKKAQEIGAPLKVTLLADWTQGLPAAQGGWSALGGSGRGCYEVCSEECPVNTYTMSNEVSYVEPKARVY